jgi:hypothetical protein
VHGFLGEQRQQHHRERLLARFLRDHGDPASAFAAFEASRRGRVEKLIAQARRTSNQKIPNPLTRMVRDRVILPLVSKAAARTTRDWVSDYRIDWDAPAGRLAV